MGEIYVVTSGGYSAYRVLWATTDRSIAERFLADIDAAAAELAPTRGRGDDYNEVQTFPLVSEYAPPTIVLRCQTDVEPDGVRRGPYERVEVHDPNVADGPPPPVACETDRWVSRAGTGWVGNMGSVRVHTCGTDYERVRKVHSERVAEAVADFEILVAGPEGAADG